MIVLLNIMANKNTDNQDLANSSKSRRAGLAESLVSIICYLGAFVAGTLVLKLSKQNAYIRFNAAQSTIFTTAVIVLALGLNIFPVIGSLLSLIVAIGGVGLWVIMIIKAYKHEDFRIPVISYWADRLVEKLDQHEQKKQAEAEAKAAEEAEDDDTVEGDIIEPDIDE